MPALLTQMSTGPSAVSAVSRAPSTSALDAHIRLDGDPADEVGGPGRAFEVEVEHGDPRTVAGEADADRLAEPRTAAGDDGDLPGDGHGSTTARPSTSPFRSRR